MGFDFPPLVVSNPLPPQTASHCTHQLFKVLATAPNYSSPHQTRSSGHANGGFLFSCLPSFGQPSSVMLLLLFFFFLFVKDYCGLFFFSLFFFSPPILFPVPPVCQSVILCASTKPSVLITWWKRSQVYLLPGWGSRSEDKPEGREEAAVVELGGWCWWVNHLCILITSLCGACIQPAVWGGGYDCVALWAVWMGNPNLIKLLPTPPGAFKHILTLQWNEEAQGITDPVTMLQSQT